MIFIMIIIINNLPSTRTCGTKVSCAADNSACVEQTKTFNQV